LKEAFRRLAGSIVSGMELYRKLSRSQQISLLLVAGLVVFFLGFFTVSPGRSPGSRGEGEKAAAGGRGSASQGSGDSDSTGFGWPYKSGGLLDLETPDKFQAKLREATCAKLAMVLRSNDRIEEGTVVCSPPSQSRFAQSGDTGSSAAVFLKLKKEVAGLSRQEADAIRHTVSCALGLKPERISIADDRGRSYKASSDPAEAEALHDREERWRTLISDAVGEYFSKSFSPGEFYVAVMVYLSPESRSIDKEEFDERRSFTKSKKTEWERVARPRGREEAQGGLISPEDSPTVQTRETTEEVPFATREKTHTSIPPGSINGISVCALLDSDAVRRARAKDPQALQGTEGRQNGRPSASQGLESYLALHEEALLSLLDPYENVSVKVLVHPFEKTEPVKASTPPEGVAVVFPPKGERAAETASWWAPTLISLGALTVLVSVIWVLRHRQRRLPMPGEFVFEGSSGQDLRAAGAGGSLWGGKHGVGEALRDWSQRTGGFSPGEESFLRGVEETSRLVRKRPEVASSVLRAWLAQDDALPNEGTDSA